MIDCTLVKFGLQRRNFHRIIHRVILADEYHESSYNNLLKLSLNEALGWCIPSEHGGRITFDIIISRSINIALARTEMVYRIESSDEMPPSRKQACPERGNCGVIARNFYETRFKRQTNTTKITYGFLISKLLTLSDKRIRQSNIWEKEACWICQKYLKKYDCGHDVIEILLRRWTQPMWLSESRPLTHDVNFLVSHRI